MVDSSHQTNGGDNSDKLWQGEPGNAALTPEYTMGALKETFLPSLLAPFLHKIAGQHAHLIPNDFQPNVDVASAEKGYDVKISLPPGQSPALYDSMMQGLKDFSAASYSKVKCDLDADGHLTLHIFNPLLDSKPLLRASDTLNYGLGVAQDIQNYNAEQVLLQSLNPRYALDVVTSPGVVTAAIVPEGANDSSKKVRVPDASTLSSIRAILSHQNCHQFALHLLPADAALAKKLYSFTSPPYINGTVIKDEDWAGPTFQFASKDQDVASNEACARAITSLKLLLDRFVAALHEQDPLTKELVKVHAVGKRAGILFNFAKADSPEIADRLIGAARFIEAKMSAMVEERNAGVEVKPIQPIPAVISITPASDPTARFVATRPVKKGPQPLPGITPERRAIGKFTPASLDELQATLTQNPRVTTDLFYAVRDVADVASNPDAVTITHSKAGGKPSLLVTWKQTDALPPAWYASLRRELAENIQYSNTCSPNGAYEVSLAHADAERGVGLHIKGNTSNDILAGLQTVINDRLRDVGHSMNQVSLGNGLGR